MSANWIPITICVCLSLIALIRLWLEFRHKSEIQLTLRKALENGNHLSLELLERIGVEQHLHAIDLRRFILLIAIGAAIIVASVFLDMIMIGLAISAFPIILSFAFFILWRIALNENKEQ
ncbi:hypothetical protein [Thalassotalea fusca]